ncbi:MAG: discoidin domain-containing protein, partial [Chitinophagaceae bacterium]|nr:discoidin domain-containing protein [Chitinophagaceae bacterium]
WNDFQKRLPTQIKRYELWKSNYSKAYYEIQSSVLPTENNDGVLWKLGSKQTEATIFWTGKPSAKIAAKYSSPILIKNSGEVKAFQQIGTNRFGTISLNFGINKATGKKIISNIPPSPNYPGNGGLFSLVNGVKSERGINSSEWCGWSGKKIELILDLGKEMDIKEINLHILSQESSWIYAPQSFEVEFSKDGITFEDTHHGFLDYEGAADSKPMKWMKRKLSEDKSKTFPVRFIKLKVNAVDKIPAGNPGAGKPAWMFIGEIEVL